MIKIDKTVHGIKLVTVWFADRPTDDDGIIQYKEARFKADRSEEFLTLISNLDETEDEIRAHFSKGCKYKVNRAYREDIRFEIIDSIDITDELLEEFLNFFEDFWKSKDSSLSDKESLKHEMMAYREQGGLSISYAVVNGERAVYHTHIYDDKTARLFHSASLYRLNSGEDNTRNIIGMANRALHFEEMKFFKNKGLHTYDWGGAGKGEDVASITEFKESFGGEHTVYYDLEQVNGIKAKMIDGLSQLRHALKG